MALSSWATAAALLLLSLAATHAEDVEPVDPDDPPPDLPTPYDHLMDSLVAVFESGTNPEDGTNTWLDALEASGGTIEDPCASTKVVCDTSGPLELNFPNSGLTGKLSAEIGAITSLLKIDLSNNELDGPLPEGFSKLTHLHYMDLHGNLLDGMLPAEWSEMNSLSHLDLGGTLDPSTGGSLGMLHGPLPHEWSKLQKLLFLDLSAHSLQGTIPPSWGTMFPVHNVPNAGGGDTEPEDPSVWLSSNQFHGPLPEAWADLYLRGRFYASSGSELYRSNTWDMPPCLEHEFEGHDSSTQYTGITFCFSGDVDDGTTVAVVEEDGTKKKEKEHGGLGAGGLAAVIVCPIIGLVAIAVGGKYAWDAKVERDAGLHVEMGVGQGGQV